jgi:ferredoxin
MYTRLLPPLATAKRGLTPFFLAFMTFFCIIMSDLYYPKKLPINQNSLSIREAQMAKLIFDHNGEEVELEDGSPIAQPCEEAGLPFACTEGVCGTCYFRVLEGRENLSSPTQEEKDFIGEDNDEERLACQCRIKCGVVRISF